MILVIGHALAKPDTLQAMLAISTEHVQRSRAEPGCISHEVTTDALLPLRLTFVERWSDMAALQARVEALEAQLKKQAAATAAPRKAAARKTAAPAAKKTTLRRSKAG